jgi:hypothetical protein
MFKNLLDKGKCSLGFHEGEWIYEDPGQCDQLRVCLRCQSQSRRTEHTWGEWAYLIEDACDLGRSCARCGQTEIRLEHSWGGAVYHEEASCQQVHLCQRCGESKPAGIEHQWDSWVYLADDDCNQVQLCGRCGESSHQTQLNHDWGRWQQDDFYGLPLRVCRHCGELVFDLGAGPLADQQPSLQEMDALMEQLLAAETIEDLYKLIQAKQTSLVSPVRELYFRFAFDQYGHDDDVREALENMQGLLNLCEQYGIEATFAQLTGANEAAEPRPGSAPASATPQTAPASPAAGSGQDQVDPRLAGRYRHTDSQYSDGFSMATDTHMLLGSDGRFSWSSESAGSFGSSQSGPEYGRWFVANNQLYLAFDSGSRMVQPFELSADSLFLPQEGHYRLWTRY